MRSFISFLFLLIIITSCKKDVKFKPRVISHVAIENVLQDSTLNVRAIEIDEKGNLGFASSHGELGIIFKENESDANYKKVAETIKQDSIVPNFRSLAYLNGGLFAVSIGNPALVYKSISKNYTNLVYQENHEKVFYDSMDFWNNKEGIAIGDTTDDCLSIIITRDAGDSWKKIACDNLPKAKENEGAFAASDTNIAIVGNKTWVGTTAGRIYYSEDKGKSWAVIETPIVKDKDTEGIYSIDFYDALNGYAIGGDYTKPGDSTANKIRTSDGGKTWQLVAENQSPGYRSCVQYMPNRRGKELVAIGFKGIDYSKDSGNTWQHLSDEGFYTIRFLNDSVAYAAGSKRISKLTFN